jgi:Tol biopolymer transport system component
VLIVVRIGRSASPRQLTVVNLRDYFYGAGPRWSADGRWIAFVKDSDLQLIRPDGTGLHPVTDERARSPQPGVDFYFVRDFDWAPDGRKLVFTEDVNQPEEERYSNSVNEIAADGTARRELDDPDRELDQWIGFGEQPIWSPDGTRIARCDRMLDPTGSFAIATQLYTFPAGGGPRTVLGPGGCLGDWQPLRSR